LCSQKTRWGNQQIDDALGVLLLSTFTAAEPQQQLAADNPELEDGLYEGALDADKRGGGRRFNGGGELDKRAGGRAFRFYDGAQMMAKRGGGRGFRGFYGGSGAANGYYGSLYNANAYPLLYEKKAEYMPYYWTQFNKRAGGRHFAGDGHAADYRFD